MKITNTKVALGSAALAAAFLGGVALAPALVSSAAAQVGGPANVAEENRGPHGADLFKAAADLVGITVDQLRTEMGTDKSMADVAVAHGKTRDGLVAALVTAETANMKERIGTLVDHKGAPKGPRAGGPGPGGFAFGLVARGEPLEAAAKYLGTTTADLRTKLQSGQSLAQIAVAAGRTRDGLVQAIVADETAKIDQAVKDGKLSADRAADLRSHLTEMIGRLVDATGPLAGGPRFHARRP